MHVFFFFSIKLKFLDITVSIFTNNSVTVLIINKYSEQ